MGESKIRLILTIKDMKKTELRCGTGDSVDSEQWSTLLTS